MVVGGALIVLFSIAATTVGVSSLVVVLVVIVLAVVAVITGDAGFVNDCNDIH